MIKVHYIPLKDEEREIAYFPDTKRFFKINNYTKNLIEDIINNDENSVMNNYNISQDEYNKYYEFIYRNSLDTCDTLNDTRCNKKHLSRLVIHLTNTCNLRCIYCYANGGTYLSEEKIINQETIDKVIEVFFKKFDSIGIIQFFGGEPLLNVPMLEYACDKITRINKERESETAFAIVTNGTIINDKIINIIKKYNIYVTVSYDGPEINDVTRLDVNGKGTSNLILKNCKLLKETTGQPSTIEVTYTQTHIDKGIDIKKIVNHIQKEIPNTGIHLIPVGGLENDPFVVKDLDIFVNSVKPIFDSIYEIEEGDPIPSYSLVERFINALSDSGSKGSPYVCDAGMGTISVSVNGDVYPCFMFTDQSSMLLGNIYDDNLFSSECFNNLINKIHSFSVKANNEKCQNCFIYSMCNGCLGLNSYYTDDPFKLSDKLCGMFRNMAENVILNFVYKKDKESSEENV